MGWIAARPEPFADRPLSRKADEGSLGPYGWSEASMAGSGRCPAGPAGLHSSRTAHARGDHDRQSVPSRDRWQAAGAFPPVSGCRQSCPPAQPPCGLVRDRLVHGARAKGLAKSRLDRLARIRRRSS